MRCNVLQHIRKQGRDVLPQSHSGDRLLNGFFSGLMISKHSCVNTHLSYAYCDTKPLLSSNVSPVALSAYQCLLNKRTLFWNLESCPCDLHGCRHVLMYSRSSRRVLNSVFVIKVLPYLKGGSPRLPCGRLP